MKKEILEVPKGIRYLSDWPEFTFDRLVNKCIVDKQIPGCGYTEWCIRNNQDVILASPRRILLTNKKDQHEKEVFLALNNLDQDSYIDKDMTRVPKKVPKDNTKLFSPEEEKSAYEDLYFRLNIYRQDCLSKGVPMKILVTYDSYGMIKSILEFMKIFDRFHTVVDEFQSLLHDSRFKSTTEVKFMKILKSVEKVQFISATPTLDKYLIRLSDFRDLPYYELDWGSQDPYRVLRPDVITRVMRSVGTKIKEVIQKYKDCKYEKAVFPDGRVVISDEAVFYVNSVNHIISAIKASELKPEECNILCANTPENISRLKRLNSREEKSWRGPNKFEIGTVPLKGEKPKKYTFCTRTVYLGADFYSECARSFVFSDSNLDCLAVDVLQDLPQIMGRQRLNTNPWKNQVWFFVRSTIEKLKKDPKIFNDVLEKKMNTTKNLLGIFDKCTGQEKQDLIRNYEVITKVENYRNNYVAVDTNGKSSFPVLNEYAYVSDIRAFDIQQGDYASQFNVFALVSDMTLSHKDQEITKFFEDYQKIRSISDKLRSACEFIFEHSEEQGNYMLGLLNDIDVVKKYIITLGPQKCKALGYQTGKILQQDGLREINQRDLVNYISEFDKFIGQRISKSDAKLYLQNLYNSIGYKSTAKSSDLSLWYDLKEVKIPLDNGKRVDGYEIIKRK